MRNPLNGNYTITSNFGVARNYTNTQGQQIQDIHNGVDYGASHGTPIYSPESGNAVMQWDTYGGGNMVFIDGSKGRHFLLHLSRYEGGSRFVNEGEVVGYVGDSGNVTGTHFHWGLKRNGAWVNPLESIVISNSYNSNMETITVMAGEGLFSVASRAGLPANAEGATTIYNLNQGWRGSQNWEQLNARMGAGDILKVRAEVNLPIIGASTIGNELKAQFEKEKDLLVTKYLKENYEAQTKLDVEIKILKDSVVSLEKEILEGKIKSRSEIVGKEFRISELEAEIASRKELVNTINNNFINNVVEFIEKNITTQELQEVEKIKTNVITFFFKTISRFFDSFPKELRPVVYLIAGFALVFVSTSLAGIDWILFAEMYPQYTAIASVMSAGLGNMIVYLSSTLGGKLRDEARI